MPWSALIKCFQFHLEFTSFEPWAHTVCAPGPTVCVPGMAGHSSTPSMEKEELMGNMIIHGRFGCSNQEIVICKMSKGVEKVRGDAQALAAVPCSVWDPLGGCSAK